LPEFDVGACWFKHSDTRGVSMDALAENRWRISMNADLRNTHRIVQTHRAISNGIAQLGIRHETKWTLLMKSGGVYSLLAQPFALRDVHRRTGVVEVLHGLKSPAQLNDSRHPPGV